MKPELIEDQVAQQSWVEPVEKTLDSIFKATLQQAGSAIRRFLHGSWLGHALHPAVVTLPIGAFTTATTFDLIDTVRGTKTLEAGAEGAVVLGLASAGMAAASGLADWKHSDGAARKVGVLHATCNGGATLFYLLSWFLRRRGDRAAATHTGILGWMLLMAGGYLGGRLVDNHRLGVDHADRHGPEDFRPVFPVTELPEGEPHRAEVDGVPVLVVRYHDKIFALGEKCAHAGGPLSEGKLEDGAIRCPWHGSKYDLATGKVLDGPSPFAQPCWEARVREGMVEIRFVKKNWMA